MVYELGVLVFLGKGKFHDFEIWNPLEETWNRHWNRFHPHKLLCI